MDRDGLYGRLFELVNSCGPPDYLTLTAILGMATFSSSPRMSSSSSSGNLCLCNVQPVRKLLHWLTATEYENHEQQVSDRQVSLRILGERSLSVTCFDFRDLRKKMFFL
jgi:hypothetical protein